MTHKKLDLPDLHQHLADLLGDLDAQIARLAHAVGVSLDDHEGLAAALRLPADGAGTGTGHVADLGHADDQRLARSRLELRGLLVLRYDLIRKIADRCGPQATRELLLEAEGHLEAIGFEHGSDGLHLDTLLGSV